MTIILQFQLSEVTENDNTMGHFFLIHLPSFVSCPVAKNLVFTMVNGKDDYHPTISMVKSLSEMLNENEVRTNQNKVI